MRIREMMIAACFLSCIVSGVAVASTDGTPSARPAAGRPGGDASPPPGAAGPIPACAISDIAYSDLFRSEGLGYVASADFAAALRAVANGSSRYSPSEIPQDWPAVAADWGGSRPGLEALTALADGESGIPALIYLASMEYRSMAQRPQLKPVFPAFVRAATRDLEGRFAAKRQVAGRIAERTDAVGAMLNEAELLGAAACAPAAVAEAKAELYRARREAMDVRFSVEETESSLLEAERIAGLLLSRQRYASKRGLKCYSE